MTRQWHSPATMLQIHASFLAQVNEQTFDIPSKLLPFIDECHAINNKAIKQISSKTNFCLSEHTNLPLKFQNRTKNIKSSMWLKLSSSSAFQPAIGYWLLELTRNAECMRVWQSTDNKNSYLNMFSTFISKAFIACPVTNAQKWQNYGLIFNTVKNTTRKMLMSQVILSVLQ